MAAFAGRDAWSPIGPQGSVGFNSAAFDPVDPSVIYLALQQWPLQPSNTGGGVAKSVDGGKTWRTVSEGLPPGGISFLWISSVDRSLLFAASGDGYYRSENGGSSWTRLAEPIGSDACRQAVEWFCSPLSLSAHEARTVYAADRTGIFKSIDAGLSWETLSDPNPASPGAQHVEADPFHEGCLFALNGREIYRSEDDGRSWAVPSPGIAGGFGAFWIDRNEADVLFATNGRADLFYRS
ncbi:MAG TPA: hypothetical protein VG777_08335, partial [Thermoanaerobaculia bacterium]|nr:hypothetical protein [Thermoanaerobaculia bacterium]